MNNNNYPYWIIPGIKETNLTTSKVLAKVSEYFEVSRELIQSQTRKREVVFARQVAMFMMRLMPDPPSLVHIGEMLGDRDHTTVIHSVTTVQRLIEGSEAILSIIKKVHIQVFGTPYNYKPKAKVIVITRPQRVSEPAPKKFERPPAVYQNRQF